MTDALRLSRRQALAGLAGLAPALTLLRPQPARADLVAAIAVVQAGVVGISTLDVGARQREQLAGTGFFVADGKHVITNHHIIVNGRGKPRGTIAALVPNGASFDRRVLRHIASSVAHDLALFAVDGPAGTPLPLTQRPTLFPEGTAVAATGFPIAGVLGLVTATHAGIVAARPMNLSPQPDTRYLDADFLLTPRFQIYQLDLTAFPGQSGSPLFLRETGEVIGVLNATMVKSTKERVLSDPSGISYAIPSGFVTALLSRHDIPV